MVEYAGSRFSNAIQVSLNRGAATVTNRVGQFHPIYFYEINIFRRSNFSSVLSGLDRNANLALYDGSSNDSSSNKIDSSRNGGEDQDAIRRVLDPGTYYLRVNRRDRDTDFKLQFSTTPDPGDSFSKALKIPQGTSSTTYRDSVDRSNDDQFDVYRFQLTSRRRLTSALDKLNGNADLRLFDRNRQGIGSSNRGGRRSESIDKNLDAGIYFIRVGVRRGSSQYRLQLSFRSPTTDRKVAVHAVRSGADLFH